jgi:parvulin-like peptidyl-prolyl isomerase
MAEALFTAPPGDWAGPYRSDFGFHLVRLRSRTEARLPSYDEIAARVAEELGAKRRREANEAAYRKLRANYNVIVETPAAPAVAR